MRWPSIKLTSADFVALERRVCEDGYYEFFKTAWKRIPEVGIEPLEDNFHIRYLCDLLQERITAVALLQPKDRDLIINIPPRTLKTNIVSAFLNAWAWAKWPHLRFICASYSQTISEDINGRVSKILNSAWYRQMWGHKFKITQDNAGNIENDKGGERFATSVTGSCTGKGCDVFIIDDPLNPKESASEAMRAQAVDFYNSVARSRLNNQRVGLRMLVMQRLHEADLSGYLLANEKEHWQHVCLPATDEYPIRPAELSRFYRGGLLFPRRLFPEFLRVEATKSTYSGQYGQAPRPPQGNLFKKEMFELVDALPEFDYTFAVSDTAYTEKQSSDYTVCIVCGVSGEALYIVDVLRRQMKATECEDSFRAFLGKYAGDYGFRGVWIEPKGHGIFLNQKFAEEQILVPSEDDLKAFYADRRQDKVQRANNILIHLSNWRVKIFKGIANVDEMLDECFNFPKGKHDDFTDCVIDAVKLFKYQYVLQGAGAAVDNDLSGYFRRQDY